MGYEMRREVLGKNTVQTKKKTKRVESWEDLQQQQRILLKEKSRNSRKLGGGELDGTSAKPPITE